MLARRSGEMTWPYLVFVWIVGFLMGLCFLQMLDLVASLLA
jgi:hypothetical protein